MFVMVKRDRIPGNVKYSGWSPAVFCWWNVVLYRKHMQGSQVIMKVWSDIMGGDTKWGGVTQRGGAT